MKTNLLILLCCCLVLIGNCDNQRKKTIDDLTDLIEDVSDAPAFKVGDVTITKYELDKNLKTFKDTYKNKHKKDASIEDINQWEQEFINRAYILADATEKGYADLREIEAQVERMARVIITQPHGLLEKELTKHLHPTNDEIRQTYEYQKRAFISNIISIKNESSLIENIHISDSTSFRGFISKNKNNPDVSVNDSFLIYPFPFLFEYRDQIVNLTAGDVAGPFKKDENTYFIFVQSIVPHDCKPLDEDYANIDMLFYLLRSESFLKTRNEQLKSQLNIRLNDSNIDHMWIVLEKIDGDALRLNNLLFSEMSDSNLMQYSLNNQQIDVSVNNFISFYNNLFMKNPINKSKSQFVEYLESMAFDEAELNLALNMGLLDTKQFILDRKNYKYNLMYSRYENEIKRTINVTETQIDQYYQQHQNEFSDSMFVHFSEYIFDNIDDANAYPIYLKQTGESKKFLEKQINQPVKINLDKKIAYNSSEYPPDVVHQLFSFPNGYHTQPFDLYKNGQYYLLFKTNESGQRILPLNEVRQLIIQKLTDQIVKEKIELIVQDLKQKHLYSDI